MFDQVEARNGIRGYIENEYDVGAFVKKCMNWFYLSLICVSILPKLLDIL